MKIYGTYGTNTYTNIDYLRSRVCALTIEEVIAKSFKVKNWMSMNPDNDWVQQAGKSIINKLNSIPTFEQGKIR